MKTIDKRRSTNTFCIGSEDLEAISNIITWVQGRYGQSTDIVAIARDKKVDGDDGYAVRIHFVSGNSNNDWTLADLQLDVWGTHVTCIERRDISTPETRLAQEAQMKVINASRRERGLRAL